MGHALVALIRFGMAEELGSLAYEPDRPSFVAIPGMAARERDYSEQTAPEIDCAVREIVDAAFDTVTSIVKEKRAMLEQGAQWPLQKETLDEKDLAALQQTRPALAATSALTSRSPAVGAANPGT